MFRDLNLCIKHHVIPQGSSLGQIEIDQKSKFQSAKGDSIRQRGDHLTYVSQLETTFVRQQSRYSTRNIFLVKNFIFWEPFFIPPTPRNLRIFWTFLKIDQTKLFQ